MALVAGIDLSTQSCTVELRDADTFEVAGRARVALPPTFPPVSEQNTEDWWDALKAAFQDLATHVDLSRVEAVAASGQCHGLVALDRDGQTIRPVKLWNDTTAGPEMRELVAQFGPGFWVDRIGSVPTAAFTVAKLAWLVAHEPETIARIDKILLPHDYLNWRLTGEFTTDRSEASGTGYYDSVRNKYDYDLLNCCFGPILNWADTFPVVRGPEAGAGQVTEAAAAELGLRPGLPVAIGGGDQHVAALGLGLAEGDVVFSLGTSGVVFTSTSSPLTGGSRRAQVDGVANATGGWLPLVCTLNCTKVTNWAGQMLGADFDTMSELALAADLQSPSLPIFAAFLDGERSPALPEATGVLSQLDGRTTRSELVAGFYLGVLFGLLSGLDAISESGVPTGGTLVAVGGGARSKAYLQLLADLTGRPVQTISEPEATARGASLQALALLRRRPLAELAAQLRPQVSSQTEPRRGEAAWPGLRERYRQVVGFAARTRKLT